MPKKTKHPKHSTRTIYVADLAQWRRFERLCRQRAKSVSEEIARLLATELTHALPINLTRTSTHDPDEPPINPKQAAASRRIRAVLLDLQPDTKEPV